MSNGFTIKGENGNYLRIKILEVFNFPASTSHWGGYEIRALIQVKSGNFTVSESFYSTSGEIYRFWEAVKATNSSLSGKANYNNFEQNLSFSLIYDKIGHVEVTGSFSDYSNELHFEFITDQSFIQNTLLELDLIVEKYGDMKGIK